MKTTMNSSQRTMTSCSPETNPTLDDLSPLKKRQIITEVISDFINIARQKQQQVEELLKRYEERVVNENTEECEIQQVLVEVKKIAKMMKVLCKLILNKSQQSDATLYYSVQKSLRLEQQLQEKSIKIHQLNATIDNLKTFSNKVKNQDHCESFFAINSSYDSEKNLKEQSTQTQSNEETLSCQQKTCCKNNMGNLGIQNQMTLSSEHFGEGKSINWKREWKQLEQQNALFAKTNTQQPKSSEKKFQSCHVVGMQVQPAHSFMKRYKSVIKICLNSLNLLTKVYELPKTSEKAGIDFCLKMRCFINEIAENFNQKYHRLYHKYDDQFCLQTKEKVKLIYESMYTQWKFKGI